MSHSHPCAPQPAHALTKTEQLAASGDGRAGALSPPAPLLGAVRGEGSGRALPFCVQVLHTFPTWPQRPFPAMLHGADGRALPVKFTELYERVQVHTSGVMTETSFEPRCF